MGSMTHLFDETEQYTLLGKEYDQEISLALRPIFERAIAQGHSLRDLQYITNLATVELALVHIIGWDKKIS
jgi:hypothetical protein